MRNCFAAVTLAIAAANAMMGAISSQPDRTIVVIRADARTGRLIRGVVPTEAKNASSLREIAEQSAELHSLDPLLVDSVIRVESNYNPYAVSPKGARGLMQLMPATARWLGVANAFDSAQNIEGGVRYLKYLLELYKGDYRLALAAYNAGEEAVARHQGIPPYPETRQYVYQVGRKLDKARATQRKQPAAKTETNQREHPRIEHFIDAEGRDYYRTQ